MIWFVAQDGSTQARLSESGAEKSTVQVSHPPAIVIMSLLIHVGSTHWSYAELGFAYSHVSHVQSLFKIFLESPLQS